MVGHSLGRMGDKGTVPHRRLSLPWTEAGSSRTAQCLPRNIFRNISQYFAILRNISQYYFENNHVSVGNIHNIIRYMHGR